MDSTPPRHPSQLLNELEAIRQLLDQDAPEPPLLSEVLDGDNIPLLSDIIEPGPGLKPQPQSLLGMAPDPAAPSTPASRPSLTYPVQPAVAGLSTSQPALEQRVQNRLDAELRAAAELLLQDVIDDFVPKIEAELHRRLEARLERLITQSKS